MDKHAADLAYVRNYNGWYLGLLNAGEQEAFWRLVKAGLAAADYSHPAGMLGLAKVRIL